MSVVLWPACPSFIYVILRYNTEKGRRRTKGNSLAIVDVMIAWVGGWLSRNRFEKSECMCICVSMHACAPKGIPFTYAGKRKVWQ